MYVQVLDIIESEEFCIYNILFHYSVYIFDFTSNKWINQMD